MIVPELVLILSRRSCNTICRNSDEAHVFCSTLPFQPAPEDVCISNRSRVTASFVKIIAFIPLKKMQGKNERKYKFIHSHHPHFPRPYIWHFLSWNIIPLQLNMPSFSQPIFSIMVSNFSFRSFGFLGSPGYIFRSSGSAVYISMMKATRNHMVRGPGCMVDALSLRCYGAQATLAQEHPMWLSIVLMKNPSLKKFWLFPPDIIKEFFQYHLVILLTYPCIWRADMLIDHPSGIKEDNQHHFAHWLLLINIFHSEFATMEPHLWLMFYFRIVFINSNNTGEKVWILGDSMPDFPNTPNNSTPFLLLGEHEESTLNKLASFQVPLLKCTEFTFLGCVGHLPAFKWMNDGPPQSPLTLSFVATVFGLPLTCSISVGSLPSVNSWIMQSFI